MIERKVDGREKIVSCGTSVDVCQERCDDRVSDPTLKQGLQEPHPTAIHCRHGDISVIQDVYLTFIHSHTDICCVTDAAVHLSVNVTSRRRAYTHTHTHTHKLGCGA